MHGFDSHQHLKNKDAQVVELVYTRHLKCRERKLMWVRLPPWANQWEIVLK